MSLVPPKTAINPPALTVVTGNQAVFECNASGDPTLHYEWRSSKNDIIISTNRTLNITVTSDDSGLYNCTARNDDIVLESARRSSAVALLFVQGRNHACLHPLRFIVAVCHHASILRNPVGKLPKLFVWECHWLCLVKHNTLHNTFSSQILLLSQCQCQCTQTPTRIFPRLSIHYAYALTHWVPSKVFTFGTPAANVWKWFLFLDLG